MGTSQSSTGPVEDSPLIPPWADDQPQQALPKPDARRFVPYRGALSNAVSNGKKSDIQRAIGYYARKASGGCYSAARRLGSVTHAGVRLFSALIEIYTFPGKSIIDLNTVIGLPIELAISTIAQTLTSEDGDSEKIYVAMNNALINTFAVEFNNTEIFHLKSITDDTIVYTVVNYLAESIFLQMVMDSNKAWNKADTPFKAIYIENELRALIKMGIAKYMLPKLSIGNMRSLAQQQLSQIVRQTIIETWREWETY